MADAALAMVAESEESRVSVVERAAGPRTPWAAIALAVLGLRILLSVIALGTVWALPGSRGTGLQSLLLEPGDTSTRSGSSVSPPAATVGATSPPPICRSTRC